MYIIGGNITDLAAEQTRLTTVQVTWTAPPGPPAGGYQITVDETSIDVTGQESPYTFTTSGLGVHTVQVLYTSQHFPNEQAMPVMVTVEGEGDSIVVYITIMYDHSCIYRHWSSNCHHIITDCHISHHLLETSACSVPSPSSLVHSITDTSHWEWPSTLFSSCGQQTNSNNI